MASNINIKKINRLKHLLTFLQQDVDKFGKQIVDTHKKQIQHGIDADGNQFAEYTQGYAKNKANNKANKSQISRQVNPPNLTLTGAMLDKLMYIKGTGGKAELEIDYGITDSIQATKLKRNQSGMFPGRGKKMIKRTDKKRVIAKPNRLGTMVEAFIVKMFAIVIAKNLTRVLKRQTKITYKL